MASPAIQADYLPWVVRIARLRFLGELSGMDAQVDLFEDGGDVKLTICS